MSSQATSELPIMIMQEHLKSPPTNGEILNLLRELNEKLTNLANRNPSFRWLDIADTCKILKISTRTLQNYRDEAKIGFSQIGSKIYFSLEDIERFMKEHYIKPSSK